MADVHGWQVPAAVLRVHERHAVLQCCHARQVPARARNVPFDGQIRCGLRPVCCGSRCAPSHVPMPGCIVLLCHVGGCSNFPHAFGLFPGHSTQPTETFVDLPPSAGYVAHAHAAVWGLRSPWLPCLLSVLVLHVTCNMFGGPSAAYLGAPPCSGVPVFVLEVSVPLQRVP